MSTTLETAYDYITDIEAYFDRTLPRERLKQMLVSMLNEGIGWKLQGELRDERDRLLAIGEIVGVIQNAWDDINDCVLEAAHEKVYFTREDAALINRRAA